MRVLIRGSIAQSAGEFSALSNNKQCTAVSAVVVLLDFVQSFDRWQAGTLDFIVRAGDGLYRNVIEFDRCLVGRYLMFSDLQRYFVSRGKSGLILQKSVSGTVCV